MAADAQEIIRSELLEPRGKGAAKGEEEDHGTTPACSTRAAMKKVCLLWQIIAYSIYGQIACVLIDKNRVWIIDATEFGSVIQVFGSLIILSDICVLPQAGAAKH